ncbi:transketolase [Telmatospirillum sp. J64-1]|uniref:transketolase n=1 Tax=Telmatospirillum sp. J64-1 TaxID=2502183 RepID=UPI00115CC4EC|nr:transketolase [Telmatospirillum sp. J64-1]
MTAQLATAPSQASHAELANAIRFLSVDAVEKAKSGHPGMPMGMADVATVLFTRFLKFDANHPRWADRDRFILSAGHGSMLLYSLAYLTGYEDINIEQIKNFRQLGARTAGHPEFGHVSAAETTTGPLGQGIANAVGFALAEKMLAARHGSDIVDHYTYVIAGDGCLMEGISQEAISLAGHLRLNKLIVLWDDNHICIDGDTEMAVSDDQLMRFQASNWDVCRVDGHDPEAIAAAIDAARKSDKPSLIACRTTIGYGAPTKAGSEKTHGAPLGADEIAGMREKLGWPHAPFEVPDSILTAWRLAGSRGADARRAWEGRVEAMPAEAKAEFLRTLSGRLPAGWQDKLTAFKKKVSEEQPKWATRKASQEVLEVLTAAIPELVGGSADLTHSNLTITKSTRSVTPTDFSGRYLHYGVREHGMAAAMNGLALHGGFVPYGGTFFVFSDYLRPALRMSALMGQRVLYVLTHDSIGLGEDGPTHQPIEHLASLRAMPNVLVFRPCDAVETAECYEVALSNEGGPSVFALSRHNIPTVRQDHVEENLSARGAYVLSEPDQPRQVTILATGTEVPVALVAQAMLHEVGIATAVVSMPCWELFAQQPTDYRRKVLGSGLRIAIEAGSTFGWERWVGDEGAVVGMRSFGASGPAEQLYAHFDITAQSVADIAMARLGKAK